MKNLYRLVFVSKEDFKEWISLNMVIGVLLGLLALAVGCIVWGIRAMLGGDF